ncbi:MAG: DUF3194 domain-containing protein [Candidatus Helarchaeota archaeon]|nr:DUF3194 domain-containing protein [Candidatus Helarchaeota archaeon]
MSDKTSFSIQNLTLEQVEELLSLAEQAGREYIQSQIPRKELKTFDILIEFNSEDLTIDCVIDLELTKQSKLNPKKVTDEAVQKIYEVIESEP